MEIRRSSLLEYPIYNESEKRKMVQSFSHIIMTKIFHKMYDKKDKKKKIEIERKGLLN